jgi:hypothetical protein
MISWFMKYFFVGVIFALIGIFFYLAYFYLKTNLKNKNK